MSPDDLAGLLDGLRAPAWVVALALAAYLGARLVILLQSWRRASESDNGGGWGFEDGVHLGSWRTELKLLVHNQSDLLRELRGFLREIQTELRRRAQAEAELTAYLRDHHEDTTQAIGLVEEIHREVTRGKPRDGHDR